MTESQICWRSRQKEDQGRPLHLRKPKLSLQDVGPSLTWEPAHALSESPAGVYSELRGRVEQGGALPRVGPGTWGKNQNQYYTERSQKQKYKA